MLLTFSALLYLSSIIGEFVFTNIPYQPNDLVGAKHRFSNGVAPLYFVVYDCMYVVHPLSLMFLDTTLSAKKTNSNAVKFELNP